MSKTCGCAFEPDPLVQASASWTEILLCGWLAGWLSRVDGGIFCCLTISTMLRRRQTAKCAHLMLRASHFAAGGGKCERGVATGTTCTFPARFSCTIELSCRSVRRRIEQIGRLNADSPPRTEEWFWD